MTFLVIWILFGIGAAIVAGNRGENGLKWFFLGCLFGPFGLLFSFFAGGRQCPFCMSKIHQKATICPKCQQKLPGEIPVVPMKKLY